MSSGSHLSRDIYDLIKAIGETRSKQEEDKIITTELNQLKVKINEKNIPPKRQKENLIRAIYIEMLGHDASFSYIHAVYLAQSKTLNLKRMGYLACSLFFHENQELLVLMVATIQRDLSSANPQENIVALNCLSKLLYSNIVHALVEPVIKLSTNTNSEIRKKSMIVMHKIYNISQSLILDFHEKMKRALCDKDPSVMGVVLNVYYDEIKKSGPQKFKDLASSFAVILKQIIEHKLAREYDYHRFPAPWIQIKILQIISLLCASDLKTSEQVYEVLSQTLKRADDTGINIGYAVTYQCVKTIASIYPNSNLLEQAALSIARFLHSENNNLKYLGINALIMLLQINPKYALDHQMAVVDSLESKDETLKRETLELLFRMTNSQNVEVIVQKLINYLKMAADPHFKKEMVNKVMILSERFAPNQEWFLNTMNSLFEFGGEFITENILINVIKLIDESYQEYKEEGFGEFVFSLYQYILGKDGQRISSIMMKLIAWVYGEIGADHYAEDPENLEHLSQNLLNELNNKFEDELTYGYIINALAKLSTIPQNPLNNVIGETISYYSKSKQIDIGQRCNEYRILNKFRLGLRQSSLIVIDQDLKFLDDYVQQSISQGGNTYKSGRNMKSLMSQLESGDSEKSQINYLPYSQQEQKKNQNKEVESSGINVKSKTIWTKEGRVKNQEDEPSNTIQPKKVFNMTQAISSEDFKGNSMSSTTIQQKQTTGFVGSGGGVTKSTSHYSENTFTINNNNFKRQEYVDPALEERKKKAQNLFSGVGGSTQSTTSKFGPFGGTKSKQNTQNQNATQSVKKNQAVEQPKQGNSMNLLDFMDDNDNSSKNIPQKQQQQQKNAQNILDIFGDDSNSHQQQQVLNFINSKVSMEVYEQKWEEFNIELNKVYKNTRVKSEQDFRTFIQKINFSVIEVIGNEVICSGVNRQTQNLVLLYGTFESNGDLDIRTKSQSNNDQNNLFQDIEKSIY